MEPDCLTRGWEVVNALFNLAIDSKLRACDLVKLPVSDVAHGGQIESRAMVMQQKTGRPASPVRDHPTYTGSRTGMDHLC